MGGVQVMLELRPGDIVAERGKGITAWFNRKVFVPHTDRLHFFLIDSFIEDDNDYSILENIGKGIAIGRLSWYKLEDLEIYRLNDPECEEIGRKAVAALSKHGRARYYIFFAFKIFLSALKLILTLKFPPWKPSQLAYVRDAHLLGVEAVYEAYRAADRPIVPDGVYPAPAMYREALEEGKLVMIFKGSS